MLVKTVLISRRHAVAVAKSSKNSLPQGVADATRTTSNAEAWLVKGS
jgi:hypothetical protein